MDRREEDRRRRAAAMADSTGGGPAGPPGHMDLAAAAPEDPREAGVSRSRHAVEIEVGRIVRDPAQPREEFDEEPLARLAESMRARGQLQPIRVRWDEGEGAYVILAGERRWRAARLAGLATVSCVVHRGEVAEVERLELQLVENALREDLKPAEQARAYRRLMDLRGWSGSRLARELSIAQSTVASALALLRLPDEVQADVDAGRIGASVAYEISKLNDPSQARAVAAVVVDEDLTREEAVEVVRAFRARRPAAPRPAPAMFEVEPKVKVTVSYGGPSTTTAVQALRKALRMAQERGRPEEAA